MTDTKRDIVERLEDQVNTLRGISEVPTSDLKEAIAEIKRLREAIVSAHAQAAFCLDVTGDCDEVLAEICAVLVSALPAQNHESN